MKKNILHSLLLGLVLIGIAVPLLIPYFHPGYFPTHDGEWAVVRLGDMFRSIRDHQFPVRYSGNLDFAYGYPLFNFAYPAPYYLGILFHFFRFGFVDTIKLLFAVSIVISSFAIYFLSKELWQSKAAGVISAVLYLYYPYRIVDLYARGSLGESLAFALFPIILLCASRIFEKRYTYSFFALGVISYSLLIMTHNIMALLFTPILFIFLTMKVFAAKRKGYFKALSFVLLSFGISSFFWLPALLEKSLIRLSVIPIADRSIYFVTLSQLVMPKWGYGLPNQPGGFTYQLGIGTLFVFLITLGFLLYSIFLKKNLFRTFSFQLAAVFSLITAVALLLMFSFSSLFWQAMPLLREINYPWTLLGVIGLLISLLGGFLWRGSRGIRYCVVFFALLAVAFTLPYAQPQSYFDKGDSYYLTNEATTTSSNEYTPLWVKQEPIKRWDQKVEITTGSGNITGVLFNSHSGSFTFEGTAASNVRVNTIYWPGWKVFVDKKEVQIDYNNPKGVIEFSVPAGTHQVNLSLGETPVRLFSDLVSLACLLTVIGVGIFLRKKK